MSNAGNSSGQGQQTPMDTTTNTNDTSTKKVPTGAELYKPVKRKYGQRSPKQTQKWRQLLLPVSATPIATSNRFGALTDQVPADPPADASSASSQQASSSVQPEKPVPFYVRDERVISTLNAQLAALQISDYDITILRRGLEAKLQLKSVKDYRAVQTAFNDAKISYYTYQLKSERPLKVAIRGIPPYMSETDVSEGLVALNFDPRRVTAAKGRHGEKSSVFLVDLNATPGSANKTHPIYNLTRFLHHVVVVEQPYKVRQPVQCYNCQEYGHTRNRCNLSPVCVVCSGSHKMEACPVEKGNANGKKCNNCQGNHTANWKGCIVYQEFQERLNPRQRREQRIANNNYRNQLQGQPRQNPRPNLRRNSRPNQVAQQPNFTQSAHPQPTASRSFASVVANGVPNPYREAQIHGPQIQQEAISIKQVMDFIMSMQTNITILTNNISEMVARQNATDANVNALTEAIKSLVNIKHG